MNLLRALVPAALLFLPTACSPYAAPAAGIREVHPLAGVFVAVGQGGAAFSSEDGLTWQRMATGSSDTLLDVRSAGGILVAVGSGGVALRTVDGQLWQRAATPRTVALTGLAHDGTRFVAVGGDWETGGYSVSSVDGLRWTELEAPQRHLLLRVAAAPTVRVATGHYLSDLSFPALFTGVDQRAWAETQGGTAAQEPLIPDPWNPLIAWPGGFASLGSDALLVSDDGTHWSAQPHNQAGAYQGLAWTGSELLAVGEQGNGARSSNGRTWAPMDLPGGGHFTAVASNGVTHVAVGWMGAVARAEGDGAWEVLPSLDGVNLHAVTFVP